MVPSSCLDSRVERAIFAGAAVPRRATTIETGLFEIQAGHLGHRAVIGKDTRLPGYMIETALIAGFTSVSMDVLQLEPMPTPAVAMLTRSMQADRN
jgi:phosphomannomutase